MLLSKVSGEISETYIKGTIQTEAVITLISARNHAKQKNSITSIISLYCQKCAIVAFLPQIFLP